MYHFFCRLGLSLIILLSFNGELRGQDVVTIHHTYYTSHFSKSKHIPVLVEYTLTAEMLACEEHIPRTGERFKEDPELPDETNLNKDYVKSGYDKGHNMSAQDNECNGTGMNECFYFSNVFPQVHAFNAGTWEQLEKLEREEAESYGAIKVFIGNLGCATTIGEDRVVVPMYCWKIIYVPGKDRYEVYIFPNNAPTDKDIEDYKTTLETIEHKSGIYFKSGRAEIRNN